MYETLAKLEDDPNLRDLYGKLAKTEEKHAALWEQKLVESGAELHTFKPGWRTQVMIFLARHFGASFVLPSLISLEQVAFETYDSQPEAVEAGFPLEERSHARIFSQLSHGGGAPGSSIARIEGRHRSGGNALRAAVLGANDGVVSNLSLVMGVAGADLQPNSVIVAGFAGLLAGAMAMAMGEWLSVQSARELFAHQIKIEQAELEASPEEEKEELALIYQSKGLTAEESRRLAERIASNPESALDTLSREELGIDPDELGGSAWVAAITSFGLFATGAIIPVLGFLLASGPTAIFLSALFSAVGLFLIGAGTTLFTGRGVLFSGARQISIGLAAAAVTFAVGRLFGVVVGG
jgi:VIT1/CCC1 family predicted Fe2+/Mn2+ transporter